VHRVSEPWERQDAEAEDSMWLNRRHGKKISEMSDRCSSLGHAIHVELIRLL
jgi:hypothetical protein